MYVLRNKFRFKVFLPKTREMTSEFVPIVAGYVSYRHNAIDKIAH